MGSPLVKECGELDLIQSQMEGRRKSEGKGRSKKRTVNNLVTALGI